MSSKTCSNTEHPNIIQKFDVNSNTDLVGKFIKNIKSVFNNNIYKKKDLAYHCKPVHTYIHTPCCFLKKNKSRNFTQSSSISKLINAVKGCKSMVTLPTEVINSIFFLLMRLSL